MIRPSGCLWFFCLIAGAAAGPSGWAGEPGPAVSSGRLEVVFRSDLNGLERIVDRATGRDYASNAQEPAGLYRVVLGGGRQRTVLLSSLDAAKRTAQRTAEGYRLRFVHQGDVPLEVICTVSGGPDDPLLRWRAEVVNRSPFPLVRLEYPLAGLKVRLGKASGDDAIVYPSLEGVLLTEPAKSFRAKQEYRTTYPGKLSAQFMYFFDPEGGFYTAAADGGGRAKDLLVARRGSTLELTVAHRFPRRLEAETTVPYEVVWTTAGGTWQSGADVYRAWVERQSWCGAKLRQRDVPQWLTRANVFLNFGVRAEGVFRPASAGAATFARYHEFLQVPLVTAAFGWERHGAWIGPEYFPPFGGEPYYRDLSQELGRRGDHLQVYTSGFRWGVRKPVSERRGVPRRYTDYDGTAQWEAKGKAATVVTAKGKLAFSQPPWADNYALCAGSSRGQEILAGCFRRAFAMGATGVDLDQDLGGDVAACYSTKHGHPPGYGVWQHRAMVAFLSAVRKEAKANNADAFLGVEEPCEAYIPWLDVYHGRAFTDTRWPATGPGAVSIPLYVYLYHEYQLGYAGWIDSGFSPWGNERVGLGRAFLFGMLPGVRVQGGCFQMGDQPSGQLRMLRDVARLMGKTRDYLLLGRMLHDPVVSGSPMFPPREKPVRGHPPLPVPWPVVQATAWRSSGGDVCYAVANLGQEPQTIGLGLEDYGQGAGPVALRRLGAVDQRVAESPVRLPAEIRLALGPWELCCIEQKAAR